MNSIRRVTGLPSAGDGNPLITIEAYSLVSTMNSLSATFVNERHNSGLSELEKISLHFMYPEDDREAECISRTALREGKTLKFATVRPARGASNSRHPMIT